MDTAGFHHALTEGQRAYVHRWLPEHAPKAVIQIIHGMAEHAGRYQRLARALTAAGYAVYAQDLPGHGRSARGPEELGHMADEGGWALALSSINGLRALIEDEQEAPLVLLGHSMGSFLLQDYLVGHGTGLAGAIYSAPTGDLGPLRQVGLALVRTEARWYGRRHRSWVAERLTFQEFNRAFRPNRTPFDWLSRDTLEVDRYVADPLCGFRCSTALWIDLLGMAGHLGERERLQRIPQRLPVLMLAGSEDPACRGAEGPASLERHYRRAGIGDIRVHVYEGARHELFNETCREQVTADLLAWLTARVPAGKTARA